MKAFLPVVIQSNIVNINASVFQLSASLRYAIASTKKPFSNMVFTSNAIKRLEVLETSVNNAYQAFIDLNAKKIIQSFRLIHENFKLLLEEISITEPKGKTKAYPDKTHHSFVAENIAKHLNNTQKTIMDAYGYSEEMGMSLKMPFSFE